MTLLMLIISIICVVLGHIYKMKRWGLYINVYEVPNERVLLSSLAITQTVNVLLPIRIGELLRVGIIGKRLKNGYALAIATVITDLCVDFVTVSLMMFGLTFIGKGREFLPSVAKDYEVLFIVFIFLLLIAIVFKNTIKHIIRGFASIFNEKIEFNVLYITYLTIASLKDIVHKISKGKFILYACLTWVFYVSSYITFAEFLQDKGFNYSTSEVFALLFSGYDKGIFLSDQGVFWIIFLLVPMAICLFISLLLRKSVDNNYKRVLPQINESDRIAFLKTYYSNENRLFVDAYLEINADVTVIEDCSAGSEASTLVVMKDEAMYYRKYAFNDAANRLQVQIDWIEANKDKISLPIICEKKHGENYVSYDMQANPKAVGMFRYIHTMPIDDSWSIIENVLYDLDNNVYSKAGAANVDSINKYIEEKVIKKLSIITNARYIRDLEKYDSIIVNGKELPTLKTYKDVLNKDYLFEVFKNDKVARIHGDLTVENIICYMEGNSYYLIDPNSENIHNTPFIDFAKLLQSLHGEYEFISKVNDVELSGDKVSYLITRSLAYKELYEKLDSYIKYKFNKNQRLSIYYHEVVNWIRLMDYKIKKNEKIAVAYYTGLLIVLKYVRGLNNE